LILAKKTGSLRNSVATFKSANQPPPQSSPEGEDAGSLALWERAGERVCIPQNSRAKEDGL